jgi:hypothetical protein
VLGGNLPIFFWIPAGAGAEMKRLPVDLAKLAVTRKSDTDVTHVIDPLPVL